MHYITTCDDCFYKETEHPEEPRGKFEFFESCPVHRNIYNFINLALATQSSFILGEKNSNKVIISEELLLSIFTDAINKFFPTPGIE